VSRGLSLSDGLRWVLVTTLCGRQCCVHGDVSSTAGARASRDLCVSPGARTRMPLLAADVGDSASGRVVDGAVRPQDRHGCMRVWSRLREHRHRLERQRFACRLDGEDADEAGASAGHSRDCCNHHCQAPFVFRRGLHPSEAVSSAARSLSECRVTKPSRLPCKASGKRWYSNPVAC
jgi:hypothetical protein